MMDPPHEHRDAGQAEGLSIPDALELAMTLHRAGHREDAYELYARILEASPNHPDALHYLGLLAHDQGSNEDALRLLAYSVSLMPEHAGFRNNLGNLLLDLGRFEEAEQEYGHALTLDPDRPDALNNYAVLCKGLGRYGDAERSLLRAIELVPDFITARNNLADVYFRQGRLEEALKQAGEALERAPQDPRTHESRGYLYSRLGQLEEAAAVYREWLEQDPGNPKALHHLAACTGQGVPPRAPDAYVQYVFDAFSNSFDSRLAMLGYQAPSLVRDAVFDRLGAAAAELDVLDAGCGTGLCAPLLKALARRLIGIDLSSGMLAKARARGLYDELCQAELTAHMRGHAGAYDLIVSADTLVYFGALDTAMIAAAGALKPGGHLCYTVEALAEDDAGEYQLRHHGRYAHGKGYLEAVLRQAGLRGVKLDPVVLRSEGGEPVSGWLVLAQKPRS